MNTSLSVIIPCNLKDATNCLKIFHDLSDVIEIINSCVTLPLVSLMLHFFIINLFSLFSLVWTFTIDFEQFPYVFMCDGTFVILNYIIQGIMAHASSSATKEAGRTSVIVSKIINSPYCTGNQRKVFKNFLIQNQYRNLKFQNMFFTINWKLLLAVSEDPAAWLHCHIIVFSWRLYQQLSLTWSSLVSLRHRSEGLQWNAQQIERSW